MKNFFFLFCLILLLSPLVAASAANGAPAAPAPASPAEKQDFWLSKVAGKLGYDTAEPAPGESIAGTIATGALSVILILFFAFMVYAGVRWMTAQGKEEAVTKAKNTMIAATIGIVLALMSYGIANFVLKYVTPSSGGNAGRCEKIDCGTLTEEIPCAIFTALTANGWGCVSVNDVAVPECGGKEENVCLLGSGCKWQQ